jgi:hypothetical protein
MQKLIDPKPVPSPIMESPWFVMLTEPQQDLTTVWRLHELGLEMFVPVIRKRVKTGRVGKNGHKVTRVIAKPMFPGYGFLRETDTNNPDALVWREREGAGVRGVREFMRDENRRPIRLPHAAVWAVFKRQMQEHQTWLNEVGGRRGSAWKRGDIVRVDEDGGAYAGLVATIDKIDSKGRIEVLLGMIRTSLPADMVVAA